MIQTYDELKAAVGSWLKRTSLDTEIPNFIQLAEAHFNRTIRATEMEARSRTTVNDEFVPKPDDFLALREIHIEGAIDQPLKYVTPQELSHIENSAYGGTPFVYTMVDQHIKIYPAPTTENPIDVEIIYIQKIPALSTSNQTNWLLTNHPDIYLHGALHQAEGFFYNDRRMPIWERKCDLAIQALNESANRSRSGTGPMIPRVRNVI